MDRVERWKDQADLDLYKGNLAAERPPLVQDYWDSKAEHRGQRKLARVVIGGIGALVMLDRLADLLHKLGILH